MCRAILPPRLRKAKAGGRKFRANRQPGFSWVMLEKARLRLLSLLACDES